MKEKNDIFRYDKTRLRSILELLYFAVLHFSKIPQKKLSSF